MRGLLVAIALCCVPTAAAASWPPLELVVERARISAPSVVDAEGQLGIAHASREGATVSWLTNPYAELQFYRGVTSRAGSGQDLAFTSFLAIPVELNGQRPSRIREADAMARWKSNARDDARARAAGLAVALYGEALAARARVELAIKSEADARAEAEFYAARVKAGDATVVEQSLAEAELARYAQHRTEALLTLAAIRQQLEVLTAIPDLTDPPLMSADPPALRTATAEALGAKAQGASPTIRALASESTFWAAVSDRSSRDKNVPLAFIVNFGRTDFGDFQVGGGLAWSFPLTQRAQGPVAMADAAGDRARTLRDTVERIAGVQGRRLYEQYDLLRTAIAGLDATGIPAQERVVDATMSSYKAGKAEFVRVLQARRDLSASRSRRLDLVVLAWQRYGEMTALLGELP